MVGGNVFANFIWKSRIARTYWLPRQMSSSSLSRFIMCDHTGNAMLMSTDITLMPTSSAAIA